MTHETILCNIFIGKMTFEGFEIHFRENSRGLEAAVSVNVICVDTKETVSLISDWVVVPRTWDETKVLQAIRNAAINLMIHEVLEHFFYKGTKVFDPHLLPKSPLSP